jgi:trehalose/maltose hydrolase-like predicted phosphorylase
MITNSAKWSHPRGNPVVPSPWQATQGNAAEGTHIASAGGTWQILVCGFGGFRVRHQQMTFNPWLPDEWQEIRFRLR